MKEKFVSYFKFYAALLLFFVVIFNLPLTVNGEGNESSYDQIGIELQALMAEGDIPGLSLVIVKGNEDVFMKGYGYADIENQVPVTPDTVFEIGSCSKAFTALAALHCQESGLINLEKCRYHRETMPAAHQRDTF